MKYVMSDIHGCYDEYIRMLELINFSDVIFRLEGVIVILKLVLTLGHSSNILSRIKSRKARSLLMGLITVMRNIFFIDCFVIIIL